MLLKPLTELELTMALYNLDVKSAQKKLDYESKQYPAEMQEMISPYYTGVHNFSNRSRV